jgi:hypothetical protein
VKIGPIVADARIDLTEAKAIEGKALRAGGPANGISSKTHRAITDVLSQPDVFIEPEARSVLEAVLAIPVVEKPPSPTKRSELFSTDEPLALKITADFTTLFANKTALGRTEGVAASVEVAGENGTRLTVASTVRTRGASSINSLPEPKLKLRFDRAARQESPFKTDGTVEVGVQGGTGGKDVMGRLLAPEAVTREAAVHAMLEELGLHVPRTRVASVEYVDTATGTSRHQKAFLIEDVDTLATRVFGGGATELGEYGSKDHQPDAEATLRSKDVIMLYLAQALVGNSDYSFTVVGNLSEPTVLSHAAEMHNTKLIMKPDPVNASQGDGKPVMVDFDLSLMVLQAEVGSWYPQTPENHLVAQLQQQYQGQPFNEAAAEFVSRREAALRRLNDYPLDDASKAFLTQRLEAFVAALAPFAEEATHSSARR